MRNGKKTVLAILLAGCCAFSGCGAQAEEAEQAEQGNFVTGTVECKEVYIRAKIPGYLTDIPVEEGQEVKKGDLLFSTDQRDVQVKQTQASATAQAAAGQVEAAKNAVQAAAAVVDKANANVQLLEMSNVYRLSRLQTVRRIYVPSVLPFFRMACVSALGLGWKAGIAAEVLTVPRSSIGRMISESKLYLMTEELFAWTLAVIGLSLLLQRAMLRLLQGRESHA